MFNWIKNFFVKPTIQEQALKKISELEQENFEAILTKIQWECIIYSKSEQIRWLSQYKGNQNG